jgi:dihydrolipoamide dehydrogenase
MYDLVVIGGGPGGYVAAIRGAQAGLKTALIEKDSLGGTCLNRGCIPTKCLYYDVGLYNKSKSSQLLIGRENLRLDLESLVNRKRQVVDGLVNGVKGLLKKRKVDVFEGTGRLLQPGKIAIDGISGDVRTVEASSVILATGSKPAVPSSIQVDGEFVQTTDQALDSMHRPKSVVVIGGGVIGMELADIYRKMDAHVTVVEMLPNILGTEDHDICSIMLHELQKAKMALRLESSIQEINKDSGEVLIADKNGKLEKINCDLVLVATGRTPVTTGVQASELGLEMEAPFVKVNEHQQTNLTGVYAIGDVTGGLMLAHKASAEAEVAVNHILGQKTTLDLCKIPRCVWGAAEIGAVGLSEKEAKEAGYRIKVGSFPLSASGAAQTMNNSSGMVKIVGEAETGEILGVHIIGPHATDLIAEAVTTMKMEGAVEDLYQAIKPHPTVSEAVMEAALDWNGLAIHKV